MADSSKADVSSIRHQDVTYKVIGVAMAVHNELGPGHREEVYEEAMIRRLTAAELSVQRQAPVDVPMDGGFLLTYYLDLLVEQDVVVALKALSHTVTNDDIAQVIDYLAATGHPVALLMNFGRVRLEYKRILPPTKITEHRHRQWTKPANTLDSTKGSK